MLLTPNKIHQVTQLTTVRKRAGKKIERNTLGQQIHVKKVEKIGRANDEKGGKQTEKKQDPL